MDSTCLHCLIHLDAYLIQCLNHRCWRRPESGLKWLEEWVKKTGLILTWVCLGWLSFIELVTTLWNKEEMSSLISSFIEPLKTFTEFYLTTFWYFSFPALLLNPSLIQLKTRKFLERSPSNLGVKPVINSRKWLTKCCNRRAEMKGYNLLVIAYNVEYSQQLQNSSLESKYL